jgi:hypothetical protein
LNIDPSELLCQYLVPVGIDILVFCEVNKSKKWKIIPIVYGNPVPYAADPLDLPFVEHINPSDILWFDSHLYILNGMAVPEKAVPGTIIVFNFEGNYDELILNTIFRAGLNEVPAGFNIASFKVIKSDEENVNQIFILDGFGHGIFYATFDAKF